MEAKSNTAEENEKNETYYLSIDNSGTPIKDKFQIFQVEKNSTLQIEIFNGLDITNGISLVSNAKEVFPLDLQQKINLRTKITKDDFSHFIFGPVEISTKLIFKINLQRGGPIIFFFIFYDKETNEEKYTTPFYINVLPRIIIKEEEIKLNDIQLQTVLSKSLGKIEEFDQYFEEASKLKYNFIHFTPIQELGDSQSLYCHKDNNIINNCFFSNENLSEEEKLQSFTESLEKARSKYKLGSVIDIVLNHVSYDNEWVKKNPECGFNLENAPWLNCSYALDKILINFSNAFCESKSNVKCQPYCSNEKDLNDIMTEIKNLIDKENLFEYFIIDPNEKIKILDDFWENANKPENKNLYEAKIANLNFQNENEVIEFLFNNCLENLGENRNKTNINIEILGCCVAKLIGEKFDTKINFRVKCEQILDEINKKIKNYINCLLNIAIENTKNQIYNNFIKSNNNKAEKGTKNLIQNYFIVNDEKLKNQIFLCDGYIPENSENTTELGNNQNYFLDYFKRKVNVWGDCIKLNYGYSPVNCPFLMKKAIKYINDMARIFNGFVINDITSIPVNVLEFLMQEAREINPDLLLITKLAKYSEKEFEVINKIGINLLIEELIWDNDTQSLSNRLNNYINSQINDNEKSKYDYFKDGISNLDKITYLSPSSLNTISFDLTHDNITYYQKFNNLGLNLTTLACNSFSPVAIGSTRGFDQLFPLQPSVVNENRKYNYNDDNFLEIISKDEPKKISKAKRQMKKKSTHKLKKLVDEAEKNDEKKDEKTQEGPKEVMTKFEIKYHADKLFLALSNRDWKPDIQLTKKSGVFKVEVPLPNHTKIYYKYVVNGKKWIFDNNKPKEIDADGNVNNYVEINQNSEIVHPVKKKSLSIKKVPNKENKENKNKKKYDLKDLKIIRRELNKIRNDLTIYKNNTIINNTNQYLYIFRTFIPDEEYLSKTPNFDGYALICRTGYENKNYTIPTRIELPGIYSEFVCACSINVGKVNLEEFNKNEFLSGIDSKVNFVREGSYLNTLSKISNINGKTVLDFQKHVQANTVIVLKYKLNEKERKIVSNLEKILRKMYDEWPTLTKDVDISDINLVLYKCEKEELDNTNGKRGTYSFEGYGPLCYAGISHLHKMLNKFKFNKDKETYCIIDNIKAGDWLFNYIIERLKNEDNIKVINDLLQEYHDNYIQLNPSQKVKYMTKIIDTLYNVMVMKLFDLIQNKDIINFSELSRNLLIAIPEFLGYIESSRFRHNVDLPFNKLSLATGIPHFCTEFFRCWGRDTFISFRGIFLIPGLFSEAKAILIKYASVMRHGLIPNLLDSGNNCRYNSRDTTWFFIKSVIDYVEFSQDYAFFSTPVNMVFLSDDINVHKEKLAKNVKLIIAISEIIKDIIQKHVKGIAFKEWKAGYEIDSEMSEEGFNVNVYFNKENGFIYGGNKNNCGTWMNKMGSSIIAKNKGIPATPRNGADIEIISLLYYSLIHLNNFYNNKKFPYNDVTLPDGKVITYLEWAEKIKNNFEKYFYIDKKNVDCLHDNTYRDYISDDNDSRHESQLRPNVFIALSISPELFKKSHAMKFMKLAEEFLVVKNCMGIRTLDKNDNDYNGNYEQNDNENFNLANGYNYHNGPEWVFLSGFYLMSKMIFNEYNSKEELLIDISKKLVPFERYIKDDIWSGLPELTNKDGYYCESGCNTFTRSVATLLEVLYELNKIKLNQNFKKKRNSNLVNKNGDKRIKRGNSLDDNKKKRKKVKKSKTMLDTSQETKKKKTKRNKTYIKSDLDLKDNQPEEINIKKVNDETEILANKHEKININEIINKENKEIPDEVVGQQHHQEKPKEPIINDEKEIEKENENEIYDNDNNNVNNKEENNNEIEQKKEEECLLTVNDMIKNQNDVAIKSGVEIDENEINVENEGNEEEEHGEGVEEHIEGEEEHVEGEEEHIEGEEEHVEGEEEHMEGEEEHVEGEEEHVEGQEENVEEIENNNEQDNKEEK